jgi:hypothetical protein
MSWLKPRPTKNFDHVDKPRKPLSFEDTGPGMSRAEGFGSAASKSAPFAEIKSQRDAAPEKSVRGMI